MTKAAKKNLFPGWRFGPDGECELFQSAEDVPEGWTRIHPANQEGAASRESPLSGKLRDELLAIAEAEGIDVSTIEGTGANGNVLVDDIKEAIEANRN